MDSDKENIIKFELAFFEDKEPSVDHICDNIYIGNYPAGLDKNLLLSTGITHILIAGKDMLDLYNEELTYKTIPIYDSPYTDITKYFDVSNEFINEGLKKGKVLVHCGAGISRSVSLVLVYLIKTNNLSYSEAISLVKARRKIANPNQGFEKQLREYSYTLHNRF